MTRISLFVALLALGCFHRVPDEPRLPGLLYLQERHGQRDLYVYDLETRTSKALTNDRYLENSPIWDQHGNVVHATDRVGQLQIFTMSQGKTFTALTDTPAADNFDPALGADGRICFTSNRDGQRSIYAMSADRQTLRHVTDWAGEHQSPSPLTDGRILFVSDKTGKRELWVVDGDGKNAKPLTQWEMDIQGIAAIPREWERRWMTPIQTGIMRPLMADEPDVVLAARNPRGDLDLYRWNWQTGLFRNLTNRPGDDDRPVVLANGLIAYTHTEGTQSQIWVMDSYGRYDRQLDTGPGQAYTR